MTDKAEVVVAKQAQIVPADGGLLPQQSGDQMIAMIEKIVMTPEIPIDRLEKMLEMKERIEEKKAEQAFVRAMSRAQANMRPISADANNPQTRSKYASHAQLDGILRPIYTHEGLSLSFDEGDTDKDGYIRVLCYVSHEDGFSRTYHKDVPVVNAGIKGVVMMTPTHANASADSYGMRYLEKKIFNIAVGEFDDDGNQAGNPVETITEEQQATIQDLLDSTGANKALFLKWAKVKKISEINAGAYNSVVAMIKRKQK